MGERGIQARSEQAPDKVLTTRRALGLDLLPIETLGGFLERDAGTDDRRDRARWEDQSIR